MEMEEMQLSKRSRVGNGGGYEAPKQQQGRHVEDGDGDDKARLRAWQNHASRICRVSRASGGKDRHSKVLTAKGLRDRRVRLSVSTAIQFYDLQDRLGYDQPSKAVEWLIKAASAAIGELPSLDAAFPDLESQLLGYKHSGGDSVEKDETLQLQQQQHLSLEKSACSSTSETSKGSVLSLSRSESRVKARERAKERTTARDKEKNEQDDDAHISDNSFHQSINHDYNSHGSFTDLLTGGGGSSVNHNLVTVAHASSSGGTTAGFMHKQILHFPPTATADYFSQAGALGQVHKCHHSSVCASQPTHFPHNSPLAVLPLNVRTAVAAAGSTDHSEIQPQQIPFVQDQLIPIAAAVAPGGDYNLNFCMSSGLAGFNRGTLQSNSSSSFSHLHHLQRLPSAVDGSNLPFFFGVAGATTHATSASADQHFPTGFDGRLQFWHLDLKGKDKN